MNRFWNSERHVLVGGYKCVRCDFEDYILACGYDLVDKTLATKALV